MAFMALAYFLPSRNNSAPNRVSSPSPKLYVVYSYKDKYVSYIHDEDSVRKGEDSGSIPCVIKRQKHGPEGQVST